MEPTRLRCGQEALEDWKKLFEECGEKTPERIVYLWNLDARIDDGTMSSNLDALLHLAQALETDRPGSKLRFDLVTRGAQPVGRDLQPNAVGQAPAIGLMRVISQRTLQALSAAASIFPLNLRQLTWRCFGAS